MCQSELIHLAADLSFFHTDYLWKMPGSWSGYPYYARPDFYEQPGCSASSAVMYLLFSYDSAGISEDDGGKSRAVIRRSLKWPWPTMMPMMASMARAPS